MLRIAASVHAAMLAHCRRDLPSEAVGLLSGRGGAVERIDELPNIAPPPHDRRAFLADPYRQFLAERAIAAAGMRPIAVYHSHPDGGAALSPEDLAVLGPRPLLQVVIALSPDNFCCAVVRVFRAEPAGLSAGVIEVFDDGEA